jgi:hypothetical protein
VDEKPFRSLVRGLLKVAALIVGVSVGVSGAGCSGAEGTPNSEDIVEVHLTFAATTGNGPVALSIGDLNQDRLMDVLVVNGLDNTLGVYIQRPSSGLPAQATMTYSTGIAPSAIAVADLDGDEWPEVLVTNAGDSSLTVFKNAKLADGTLLPAPMS